MGRWRDLQWTAVVVIWGAVLALAGFWWTIESRWEAVGEHIDRLLAEALAKAPPERPSIRGDADPGDAWDAYVRGMTGTVVLSWEDEADLTFFAAGGRHPLKVDADARRAEDWFVSVPQEAIDKARWALDALSVGTRRGRAGRLAGRPYPGRSWYGHASKLGHLAAAEARRCFVEGRPEQGLDASLDLLQFARDLAAVVDDGVLAQLGRQLTWMAAAVLADAVEEAGLEAGQALRLVWALKEVDRSWPAMEPALLYMTAGAGEVMTDRVPADWGCGTGMSWVNRGAGWRHLGSRKLMRLASFNRVEDLLRDLASIDRLPPAEAEALEARVRAEARRCRTVFTPDEMESALPLETHRAVREVRSLLGMLERAARAVATGRVEAGGEAPWVERAAEGTLTLLLPGPERRRPRHRPEPWTVRVRR